MKKLLLIILAAFMFLTSCSNNQSTTKKPDVTQPAATPTVTEAPVPQKSYTVKDLFPVAPDVHMVYRGTGNEYAEHETFVDFIKGNIVQIRDINPGTTMAKVYEISNGVVKNIFSEGEIYYRYDFTSSKNREDIILKEPVAVGTQWTTGDGLKRSITGVDVEVKVPAGTYKCVEVTTDNKDSFNKDYYAPGVGLVKTEFSTKDSDYKVTSELEKLEKGVPLKQSLRFYFPNVSDYKLYYEDRDIEINTNQDMKFKFQKELKTIPSGSSLLKVLSTNVQVLGAVVDYEKGITTVDFSSHLTSEMNAGSGVEGAIIQSIVNTFGEYYYTDKVIITVEGKPYSSGHILMKPGEFFKVDTSKAVLYK